MTSLLPSAERLAGGLIAFRRDLHRHPELSWREHRTTDRIRDALTGLGLRPQPLPTETGVLAEITVGSGDGPVVALRADIDALPIADATTAGHRSIVDGVSHACGHDVHTAALLGAAQLLGDRPDGHDPPGRIRLIFQPAEEAIPGGARTLAASGRFDDVERFVALHCDPTLPAGAFGFRAGPITSAADRVEIELGGAGGHTARPQLTTDLVHVAGRIITGVPAALGRLTDSRAGASLVFGAVHAGDAPNVIPTHLRLGGTFRTRSRAAWDAAPDLIARLVAAEAEVFGATWAIDHDRGNPPVENDVATTDVVRQVAADLVGAARVHEAVQSAGSEDFSWFLDAAPGTYVRLGVGVPDGPPSADLHRGDFDVDESCIPAGAALLAGAALALLAELGT